MNTTYVYLIWKSKDGSDCYDRTDVEDEEHYNMLYRFFWKEPRYFAMKTLEQDGDGAKITTEYKTGDMSMFYHPHTKITEYM